MISQYITQEQYNYIFQETNYEKCDVRQRDDLLIRAIGDMEADLSQKFVVPLIAKDGGLYSTAPAYARTKIYAALKAKIKELIGYDQNRNLTGTLEGTEKFLNVHGTEYDRLMKSILNHKIEFGFELLEYAQESQIPVQKLRLSRADNSESTEADD